LQWATTASLSELKVDFQWKWKVDSKTVFEYVGQVMCWRRLTYLEDVGDGFSGADYWEKNILTFEAIDENCGAETVVGFAGKKLFDLLALPLDTDPSSPEYAEASKLVWWLLTRSSMQKVVHGKGLTEDLMLGILWDLPENESADCAPGTFAWLLRQGSLHFRQTRQSIKVIPAEPAPERWKKGVFEP
jgi:hypothetical protein